MSLHATQRPEEIILGTKTFSVEHTYWCFVLNLKNILLTYNYMCVGSLPPSWGSKGAFPMLGRLLLASTDLTGALPAEWGSPAGFQQLTSLAILGSCISAVLPATWGCTFAFPQLQELSIVNSHLVQPTQEQSLGGLDQDQTMCSMLPHESLVNSSTTQSQCCVSWPHLTTLRLFRSAIHGSIPTAFANSAAFPKLLHLDLQDNLLTGTVPAVWPLYLAYLNVHNNSLSGVPASSTSLSQLQTLTMSNNMLAGELPSAWGENSVFQRLMRLELMGNPIVGTLPVVWGSKGAFPSLMTLQLSNTSLTGTIPTEWTLPTAFPKLAGLYIEGTHLSGVLPTFHNPRLQLHADNSNFASVPAQSN